mgnify:CR=1 FL=1
MVAAVISVVQMTPRGLSASAAAEYIGVGVTTFRQMAERGEMPKPRHIGRRRIWDRRELDEVFDALPREGVNEWDESTG